MRYLTCFLLLSASALVWPHTLDNCVDIEADLDRLACYDREAGRATPQKVAELEEQQFGKEQVEARTPKPQVDRTESISSRVTKVSQRARREMVFYLDNEQVWIQSSPRYVSIKEGDEVSVRRGRLGGYTLTNDRGASTRVKRVR